MMYFKEWWWIFVSSNKSGTKSWIVQNRLFYNNLANLKVQSDCGYMGKYIKYKDFCKYRGMKYFLYFILCMLLLYKVKINWKKVLIFLINNLQMDATFKFTIKFSPHSDIIKRIWYERSTLSPKLSWVQNSI